MPRATFLGWGFMVLEVLNALTQISKAEGRKEDGRGVGEECGRGDGREDEKGWEGAHYGAFLIRDYTARSDQDGGGRSGTQNSPLESFELSHVLPTKTQPLGEHQGFVV